MTDQPGFEPRSQPPYPPAGPPGAPDPQPPTARPQPAAPTQPGYPPSGPPSAPETRPPTGSPQHATPTQPAGLTSRGRVRATRVSALWIGLIVAAVVLIALLIFIAQNSSRVTVHYLGFSGHISLAVALLLAAVGGVLLVAIPGTARIIQLRRALKKNAAAAQAKR